LKASGFPIKDFGNDKKGLSPLNVSITPSPSPLNALSSSHLSFLKVSITPLSVIPEWFYQESKLFKDKSLWIPTSSSPRQSSSRGPRYLKTKEKAKTPGFPIKDFGNDGGGWIPD